MGVDVGVCRCSIPRPRSPLMTRRSEGLTGGVNAEVTLKNYLTVCSLRTRTSQLARALVLLGWLSYK
jgi:hypothetical protein